VTPPTFSSHELPLTKDMPSLKARPAVDGQNSATKKENVDNHNSITHAKFHTHGTKQESIDTDLALQYLNDLTRKQSKKNQTESLRLHSVSKTSEKPNSKLFFMLSTATLLCMSVMLVAACLGALYAFGTFFYQNRLRAYSQYTDEEEAAPRDEIEMAERVKQA